MVHPVSNRNMNPAKDYINYFTGLGWHISKIVYFQDMNKNVLLGNIIPTLTHKVIKKEAANEVDSIVRNHFQWQ